MRLLICAALGIILGQYLPEVAMNFVVTVKYVLNQLIVFCVPLIIIGFIAPSLRNWATIHPVCWESLFLLPMFLPSVQHSLPVPAVIF